MRFPAWLLLVPTTAFCAAVEQLPAPTFADTEVSTNIPFAVSFDTMSRVRRGRTPFWVLVCDV